MEYPLLNIDEPIIDKTRAIDARISGVVIALSTIDVKSSAIKINDRNFIIRLVLDLYKYTSAGIKGGRPEKKP
jgi:hypothetical protein